MYPQSAQSFEPRSTVTDDAFVARLFAALAARGLAFGPLSEELVPASLLTSLRPYQWRAASWMLMRETRAELDSHLHLMWLELRSRVTERRFFLHCSSGLLSPEEPVLPHPNMMCVPGGILADEMGLGKTVELLTCVLLNRPRSFQTEEVDDDGDDDDVMDLDGDAGDAEAILECVCGGSGKGESMPCSRCRKYQHWACAGYATRPRASLFQCGHCACNPDQLWNSKTTLIITPGSPRMFAPPAFFFFFFLIFAFVRCHHATVARRD
jgi:hypothetical protein